MDEKELKFRKLLGARIASLRKEKGLTQVQLSALIGIKDYQSLARIEHGRITTSVYSIYQIAIALEVDIRCLIDFED